MVQYIEKGCEIIKFIKKNFSDIMNFLFLCLCISMVVILFLNTANDKKYKELEVKYNEYKANSEERISILLDEIEYLNEQNVEETELNVEEILYYIEPLKQFDKEIYMEQYRKIIEKYNIEKVEVTDIYTEEELNYLYRCIETETYQCPIDAKINVVNVVFNRLNAGFGNNIVEVITAPNQFAYHRTTISDSTKTAVEYAFYNGDTTNGAIAFRSDISPETWGGWKKCHYDGYHSFYSR